MSILVNVVSQKMYVSSSMECIVEGSQEFVKFRFNLSNEWDGLMTFAQFRQNGAAYNQYLDEENTVYLPAEIKAGTCTMMLYGSHDKTIGTTNYLTLRINKNHLVSDASSTDISESLYNQLVTKFNKITSDIIVEAVEQELAEYLESGVLANLTIEDGSITQEKLSAGVVDSIERAKLAGNMDYKGEVADQNSLPKESDMRKGDVYFCTSENRFYMCNGTSWGPLGNPDDDCVQESAPEIYIGSGEMPDGYTMQVDPTASPQGSNGNQHTCAPEIYIGQGDMPEGYVMQVDPTAQPDGGNRNPHACLPEIFIGSGDMPEGCVFQIDPHEETSDEGDLDEDFLLTDAEKQEIAEMAAQLVDVPNDDEIRQFIAEELGTVEAELEALL